MKQFMEQRESLLEASKTGVILQRTVCNDINFQVNVSKVTMPSEVRNDDKLLPRTTDSSTTYHRHWFILKILGRNP